MDYELQQWKRIVHKTSARENPLAFEKAWREFEKQVCGAEMGNKAASASDALGKLALPLSEAFGSTDDFGTALFEALRVCCSDNEQHQLGVERNIIALKVDETGKWAVGISRDNGVPPDFCEENDDSSARISGLQRDAIAPDHSVCMFHKDDNGVWEVKDCFSTIHLTLSDTDGSEDFIVFDDDGLVNTIDLEVKHGELGEALLHTLQCVVLCHARRGRLPSQFPLAVVSGRRKEEQDSKQRKTSHWVSGTLNTPKACVGVFSYTVTNSGNICSGEMLGIKQALSFYLSCLSFGIAAAMEVYRDVVTNHLRAPVAASGQYLMAGERKLAELQLCASPIPGANTILSQTDFCSGNASRGDIFQGHIDVRDVLCSFQSANMKLVDFQGNEKNSTSIAVVVKVLSCGVHDPLVAPNLTMDALRLVSSSQRVLVEEISSVLGGAIQTKAGLITIMSDLSQQSYEALMPKKYGDKVDVLWKGFCTLVETVLVPLGEIGVVHADIRPGFDITSNILVKFSDDRDKASMKVVGYECLVLLDDWHYPLLDGSYMDGERTWDSMAFVWWQCVAVGYVWYNELSVEEIEHSNTIVGLQSQLLRSSKDLGCWNALRSFAKRSTITASDVKETLKLLEGFFTARAQYSIPAKS